MHKSSDEQSNSLNDSQKHSKKKYSIISQEVREKFIKRVISREVTIKEAAKEFGIKFSTSKAILQTYKREGRIGKKKTRQRKPRTTKKQSIANNSTGERQHMLLYRTQNTSNKLKLPNAPVPQLEETNVDIDNDVNQQINNIKRILYQNVFQKPSPQAIASCQTTLRQRLNGQGQNAMFKSLSINTNQTQFSSKNPQIGNKSVLQLPNPFLPINLPLQKVEANPDFETLKSRITALTVEKLRNQIAMKEEYKDEGSDLNYMQYMQ